MLEDDMIMLGFNFAKEDEFGQVAKFSMICEIVALMRMMDSPIKNLRKIDYWVDIVMEELQHHRIRQQPQTKQSAEDIIEQAQTWQIALDLFATKQLPQELLENYQNAIMELMDLYIICDGNVTSHEIYILQQFADAMQQSIAMPRPSPTIETLFAIEEPRKIRFHIDDF